MEGSPAGSQSGRHVHPSAAADELGTTALVRAQLGLILGQDAVGLEAVLAELGRKHGVSMAARKTDAARFGRRSK